jgi:uncharacterized damage-inducible protein DinB
MSTFSIDAFREWVQYTEWADATVWRAVLAHEGARADTRLRDLLSHLHMVQRLFLLVWRDQPIQSEVQWFMEAADLTELQRRATTYYPDVRQFLDTLDAESLTRGVVMPFVAQYEQRLGRTFGVPTLAETIFQVMHHSTYHRGQVNARLREVGGEPPLVDYIGWIWFGRPSADWSTPAVGASG